jgi:4-amino-4-deoxy-L-arabinose transferase-like glycosyltransferase
VVLGSNPRALGLRDAPDSASKTTQRTIGLAVLLVFIVLSRVVFALVVWLISGWRGFIHDDTASYVDSARSLLHGAFARGGSPEIFRTPGYPVLLLPAVAFRHFEIPALMENILLTAFCAWLIFKIVNELFPRSPAALWAALLYGLEPLSFLSSEKLITETLFCAQLLLFTWIMLRFLKKPTYFLLLLAGVAAGSATYTRPVTMFLGLWLILLLVLFPQSLPLRQRLARAAIFPLIFVATLAPWILRNYLVAGYPGFAGVADYNLYFYSAAAVEAKVEHESFAELNDARQYLNRHPEQSTWSEGQRYLFQRKSAQRTLQRHMLVYIPIHLQGCAVVVLDPGIAEIKIFNLLPERTGLFADSQELGAVQAAWRFTRSHLSAIFPLIFLEVLLLLYYLLAVLGLRRLPSGVAFLFCMMAAYFTLVSGGPFGMARYRTPIVPLVCISAAAYLAQRKSKLSVRTA